jgi:hypothetical protein
VLPQQLAMAAEGDGKVGRARATRCSGAPVDHGHQGQVCAHARPITGQAALASSGNRWPPKPSRIPGRGTHPLRRRTSACRRPPGLAQPAHSLGPGHAAAARCGPASGRQCRCATVGMRQGAQAAAGGACRRRASDAAVALRRHRLPASGGEGKARHGMARQR